MPRPGRLLRQHMRDAARDEGLTKAQRVALRENGEARRAAVAALNAQLDGLSSEELAAAMDEHARRADRIHAWYDAQEAEIRGR